MMDHMVLHSGRGKGGKSDGKGWCVCVLGGWNKIRCLLPCTLLKIKVLT